MEEFEKRANEEYAKAELIDGYAPFCKHIFINNFANALVSVMEITPQNEHKI